eukprot:4447653-Prorocentrum_lima.AAC.1
MTSSLVGSEMCIRDRVDTTSIDIEKYGWKVEWNPAAKTIEVKMGRMVGCLLYTSDAADDM